jgi:phosphoribosylamine--glycine ligase
MVRHGIPTARYAVFDSPEEACQHVRQGSTPVVVKADGLAAGKGAIVAHILQEAEQAIERIMVQGAFGDAGLRVVVEEFLEGQEASILSVVDGERHLSMIPSQDHKPIFDGDEGPNTGGMGAYAPAPVITDEVMAQVEEQILSPAVAGMAQEGHPFRGVLYAGLMVSASGPKVVEFNCRFGDPETQVVMPTFQDDLLELLLDAARGDVSKHVPLEFSGAAVCVVIASGGYPGPYQKGFEIRGMEDVVGENVLLFHAGTRREGRRLLTDGGRVLGVTGLGTDVRQATKRAYRAVDGISFSGAYFRRDIAHRALLRAENPTCNSPKGAGHSDAQEAPAV